VEISPSFEDSIDKIVDVAYKHLPLKLPASINKPPDFSINEILSEFNKYCSEKKALSSRKKQHPVMQHMYDNLEILCVETAQEYFSDQNSITITSGMMTSLECLSNSKKEIIDFWRKTLGEFYQQLGLIGSFRFF